MKELNFTQEELQTYNALLEMVRNVEFDKIDHVLCMIVKFLGQVEYAHGIDK